MNEYIIFWKDEPGQQVHTVVDAHDQPVRRDIAYLHAQQIPILTGRENVFDKLSRADGIKYAITVDLAREALGWDL